MIVVHLTASRFLGGPERQMLELAGALPGEYRTVFASFAEGGRCRAFLDEARRHGFRADALEHDTPHLWAAVREVEGLLQRLRADVLCCHGYKANLLGRLAARRARVPVAAVSRGWTGESLRVRLYEALDRINLRWMDRVVCVSESQAARVRRAGVPAARVTVIRNAVRTGRFEAPDPADRKLLGQFFPTPPALVVGAAGRLSPEKGFDLLVEAAARLAPANPSAGFIHFGDGPLREELARTIAAGGLDGRFVLAGFRNDLDRFVPFFDLLVLPSYTEGLPNVVLEAFAAGVPVVATAVGGTPEVMGDGAGGYLVPPGDAAALAARIGDMLASEQRRRALGEAGRRRVRDHFSFASQGLRYQRLFDELTRPAARRAAEAGQGRLCEAGA